MRLIKDIKMLMQQTELILIMSAAAPEVHELNEKSALGPLD
jgi:hypothetical protein